MWRAEAVLARAAPLAGMIGAMLAICAGISNPIVFGSTWRPITIAVVGCAIGLDSCIVCILHLLRLSRTQVDHSVPLDGHFPIGGIRCGATLLLLAFLLTDHPFASNASWWLNITCLSIVLCATVQVGLAAVLWVIARPDRHKSLLTPDEGGATPAQEQTSAPQTATNVHDNVYLPPYCLRGYPLAAQPTSAGSHEPIRVMTDGARGPRPHTAPDRQPLTFSGDPRGVYRRPSSSRPVVYLQGVGELELSSDSGEDDEQDPDESDALTRLDRPSTSSPAASRDELQLHLQLPRARSSDSVRRNMVPAGRRRSKEIRALRRELSKPSLDRERSRRLQEALEEEREAHSDDPVALAL